MIPETSKDINVLTDKKKLKLKKEYLHTSTFLIQKSWKINHWLESYGNVKVRVSKEVD